MNVLNIIQGTQAWHEIRAKRFTASEAPAMMGASKYQSRDDLLKQKATGFTPDVSESQQRLYDKGHKAEADARPIAEEIIGEDLFPSTIEDNDQRLLASMDGLNMAGEIGFEHKLYSASLAAAVVAGELDDHYKYQMDQQMLVSGADSILFMCSDGTKDNCAWMWYERDEARIKQLLAGWDQFEKDLAEYVPSETKVEAVGTAPDSLPTLFIKLSGAVSETNLPEFKQKTMAVIDSISTELVTDQDFADAEKATKFLKKGEEQLEQAKAQALDETESIADLFKTLNELKEEMRTKRLAVDKLVKAEKENRRVQILTKAKQAIDAHIGELEKSMEATANCPVSMPAIKADFAGAMKGKKTISSLESAANDTLATAKIEANQIADVMRANIAVLNEQADYGFLFSDYQQLLTKANDDFTAVVKSRIAEHKEAEAKRLEAQREQIRKEEEAKAAQKAEADRKAEQEKADRESRQAEEARKAQEVPVQQPLAEQPELVEQSAPASEPVRQATKPATRVITNDQVFNVAVTTVSSYFDVSTAEAVDMLDAIDFSERKAG